MAEFPELEANMKIRVILGLLMLLSTSALQARQRPNVLVIVADDLGYSDLGCYGGEINTPHLDALAFNGVRMTQMYNMGRCCPSRASILTGQYPHRVGLGHMIKDIGHPGYRGSLSQGAVTSGELLQAAGYRTFLSGKWHLGTPDPTQHGFEQSYGTVKSGRHYFKPEQLDRFPVGQEPIEYKPGTFHATDATVDHALEFLEMGRESKDKPWFLYLAFNAPHFPLHAWPEDIEKYKDRYHVGWDVIRQQRLTRMKALGVVQQDTQLSKRGLYWDWGEIEPRRNPAWDSLPADRRGDLARRMAIYAAMVDQMDRNIGRVVDDLKSHGEFENTLIVFISDNGACYEWDPFGFDVWSSRNNKLHWGDQLESMGNAESYHSIGSGWSNASNTPFRLYKHYSHEGGISMPAIVHWPAGNLANGTVINTPTHIIDLVPTMLEVSESEYPSTWEKAKTIPLAGESLLATWQGKAAVSSRALFFEHQGSRAVREGNWKLVATRGAPWELYDISKDRIESRNLVKRHPKLAKTLEAKWHDWARRNQVTPFPKNLGADYLPELK
tara:strand:- start:5936 stop:7597 length:1662 start_codon:yes stop_codon:yes gene_type:complete